MEKNKNFVRTKDAEEAAFYWTHEEKFELSKIETIEHFGKNIVWFIFNTTLNDKELDQLKNDYLNGRCLVEPRKYSYRRSEVKGIIRENYNL